MLRLSMRRAPWHKPGSTYPSRLAFCAHAAQMIAKNVEGAFWT